MATTPSPNRSDSQIRLRPATPADADDMARLADMAGEGLPAHLWAGLAAPGETALQVGARRAARDDGVFSWRNATIAEVGGATAGLMLDYRLPETPEPLDGLPPLARPLQALENRAPGAHYVNMLAVDPRFRRLGLAARLVAAAAERGAPAPALALIVSDGNAGARAFYAAQGFSERARETLVPETWATTNRAWILLTRPLGLAFSSGPA